mmetsp:Transcript_34139/g.29937  ORF Transcript_34139/g.29937 Transcript_34139/m.29937 type:complete len:287 (+) Transcript_34139:131-991(+)
MGNKVYYDCPGCGNEVWAYSGFAGTRCWDCPGTILSGITNATPVISHVKTACEAIADVKTKYKCPRCGDPVWAYGQFAGQPCWKCKGKNPLGGAFDIITGGISPSATTATKTVYKIVNPVELIKMAATDIHEVHGSHNIHVSKSSTKITNVYLRKTDLLPNGTNTLAAGANLLLAPVSTITDGSSVWTEHWWIVCKLATGGYITASKNGYVGGKGGIYVYQNSGWSTANSSDYNGGCKLRNEKTLKSKSSSRSVSSLINKVESMSAYWHINNSNCQDFADNVYDWC